MRASSAIPCARARRRVYRPRGAAAWAFRRAGRARARRLVWSVERLGARPSIRDGCGRFRRPGPAVPSGSPGRALRSTPDLGGGDDFAVGRIVTHPMFGRGHDPSEGRGGGRPQADDPVPGRPEPSRSCRAARPSSCTTEPRAIALSGGSGGIFHSRALTGCTNQRTKSAMAQTTRMRRSAAAETPPAAPGRFSLDPDRRRRGLLAPPGQGDPRVGGLSRDRRLER